MIQPQGRVVSFSVLANVPFEVVIFQHLLQTRPRLEHRGRKRKRPETWRAFRRTSQSCRYNYSWKSRASLLPISNQNESHLILHNRAHSHTQSRGTVALYRMLTQWKISEPQKQRPLVKSGSYADGYQANRPWTVITDEDLSLTRLSNCNLSHTTADDPYLMHHCFSHLSICLLTYLKSFYLHKATTQLPTNNQYQIKSLSIARSWRWVMIDSEATSCKWMDWKLKVDGQ